MAKCLTMAGLYFIKISQILQLLIVLVKITYCNFSYTHLFFSCSRGSPFLTLFDSSEGSVWFKRQVPPNFPHFVPAHFFCTKIEVIINSVCIDTYYPLQQFIATQFGFFDEDRCLINYLAGSDASITQR